MITHNWNGISDAKAKTLLQFMQTINLHGVLVLSPVCPKCRTPHDFQVFHSLDDNDVLPLLRKIIDEWNPTIQ